MQLPLIFIYRFNFEQEVMLFTGDSDSCFIFLYLIITFNKFLYNFASLFILEQCNANPLMVIFIFFIYLIRNYSLPKFYSDSIEILNLAFFNFEFNNFRKDPFFLVFLLAFLKKLNFKFRKSAITIR